MIDGTSRSIALVGATGDLGGRLLSALARRRVNVRALIRTTTPSARQDALRAAGATPLPVDFDDMGALTRALGGGECVVSALNGLEPIMIGLQGRVLDAAVAAGVPRRSARPPFSTGRSPTC